MNRAFPGCRSTKGKGLDYIIFQYIMSPQIPVSPFSPVSYQECQFSTSVSNDSLFDSLGGIYTNTRNGLYNNETGVNKNNRPFPSTFLRL